MTARVRAGMLAPMSESAVSRTSLSYWLGSRLALLLATLLAWVPLPLLHAAGALLGWLIVRFDRGFRQQIEDNLAQAGWPASAADVARELGRGFVEICVAWRRSSDHVIGLVREVEGWEYAEQALARGQGVIWVTPHLGSYDIAGRYVSSRTPVLAMYRPPKLAWLEPLMNAGRERDSGAVARADTSGVRLMLKSLKDGGSILVLPDQVPSGGDGVWVPFFGKAAYTMTLVPRLAQATGASVLMFFGERLPGGRGYRVRISPLQGEFNKDKLHDAAIINANVERLILQAPAQYLWSYRRYKIPAGAERPPAE